MATPEQLADERIRLLKIKHIVDISTSLIAQGSMSREEAEGLVRFARERILALVPDGEQTYEIVYAHRFRRLIDEFTSPVRNPRG